MNNGGFTMADKNADNTEVKKESSIPEDNKNREFLLNKNVSAESVEKIVKGIFEINRYDDRKESEDSEYIREPIKVVVDSYGGNLYCGLLLVNAIENSDTPIHTYCYSKAMSMGFIIFVVGHRRFASPTATLMYHDAGTTLGGTLENIQQGVNQAKRVIKRFDDIIVAYTNIKQSKLDRVKREKKNWYIFGDDAVELGLVDELLESKREKHRNTVDNSN